MYLFYHLPDSLLFDGFNTFLQIRSDNCKAYPLRCRERSPQASYIVCTPELEYEPEHRVGHAVHGKKMRSDARDLRTQNDQYDNEDKVKYGLIKLDRNERDTGRRDPSFRINDIKWEDVCAP